MGAMTKSTVVVPPEEPEDRNLIKYGLGEIRNIPTRKILGAVNIMKKPDQLLGFVPAMGGVYQSCKFFRSN